MIIINVLLGMAMGIVATLVYMDYRKESLIAKLKRIHEVETADSETENERLMWKCGFLYAIKQIERWL